MIKFKALGFPLLIFISVWLGTFLVLFLSPVSHPALEMRLQSSDPGFSQLFFADADSAFAEERSTWALVQKGDNELRFPLSSFRGTTGSSLRWDPLDQPGIFSVSSIELTSLFQRENVDTSALTPSLDVSAIELTVAGVEFALESNDSQILLALDTSGFYQKAFRIAALIAFAIALIVALGIYFIHKSRKSTRVDTYESDSFGIRAIASSSKPIMPSWVVVICGIVALAGLFMLIRGSQVIGVSWDEPIREDALAEYFRSGWLIPRAYFGEGTADQVLAVVYAPVALLMGHATGAILGTHAWFVNSVAVNAYEARHLFVALTSLLAVASVAATARFLLKSWHWSLLSVALIFSIPLWVGHSMFNIKDVPVAAGFTLYTLVLTTLAIRTPTGRNAWITVIGFSAGGVLALGSRPGIWVAIAASTVGIIFLILLLDTRSTGLSVALRSAFSRLGLVLASVTLSYGVLWVVYPAVFNNPWSLMLESLSGSQRFPAQATTLTAGIEMSSQSPWLYIPLWLMAQMPIIVLLSAAVGALWLGRKYVLSIFRSSPGDPVMRGGIAVFLQVVIVPLGAILLGSTLYGGVRQLLFIFPALALLSMLGIRALVMLAASSSRQWTIQLTWGVLTLGLVVPMIAQVRLFPFNFAYFNAAAATEKVNGNWDVDGWWLSDRELVAGQVFPNRTVCVESSNRPLAACSQVGVIEPFLETSDSSDLILREDEYVSLTRFDQEMNSDSCNTWKEVTRGLFWQDLQLSRVDICTAILKPYPQEGLRFSGLTKPDTSLLWGWDPYLFWGWGLPDSSGIWMNQSEASIGFTIKESILAREEPDTVTISGFGSPITSQSMVLRVFVNGVDVGTTQVPADQAVTSSTFDIPDHVWRALESDNVIIRFSLENEFQESVDFGNEIGSTEIFHLNTLNISKRE